MGSQIVDFYAYQVYKSLNFYLQIVSSRTMDKVSYVGNADVNAIENLYKMYRENPENVDIGWQKFFEGSKYSA